MIRCVKEKFNAFVYGIGLLSIILAIYQFFFRQGFWIDELFIGDNLVQKNFFELLKPLDKNQVAPIMFLWVEKGLLTIANMFNESWGDYFLRIYPLLCGFGIILLYYRLVLKLTDSKFISLVAYTLLVLNPVFIYYTSEVKQYICELFYAILVVYVWMQKSETGWNIKNTLLFLFVVLLSIFNSCTICFVLLPMGLYDGWILLKKYHWKVKELYKSKATILYLIRYAGALVFLGTYYLCFLHHHPTSKMMHTYWKEYFVKFRNAIKILNEAFDWMYFDLNIFICVAGVMTLFVLRKKQAFILSVFILLGHIFFSCFKLYPVSSRLVFYWMMFLPVCLASLLYFIYDKCVGFNGKRLKNILFLVFSAIFVFYFMPRKGEPFPFYLKGGYPKQALSFIDSVYVPGDVLIFQRQFTPHEYLNKYYVKNIPSDRIYDFPDEENETCAIFLKKSREYMTTLKGVNRVWLIARRYCDIKREFEKEQSDKGIPIKLSFVQETDSANWYLVEKIIHLDVQ